MTSEYRVFISYAHEDKGFVLQLAKLFTAIGVEALWDEKLTPGQKFNEVIRSYIEYSDVLVAVVSPDAETSGWVNAEIGYALALHVPVLPIALGRIPTGMIHE